MPQTDMLDKIEAIFGSDSKYCESIRLHMATHSSETPGAKIYLPWPKPNA